MQGSRGADNLLNTDIAQYNAPFTARQNSSATSESYNYDVASHTDCLSL